MRLINANGQFRVRRVGLNHFELAEIYHFLVTQSWSRFFLFISLIYLLIAFLFAGAFWITDVHNIKDVAGNDGVVDFGEIFLYSAQTLSTVGNTGNLMTMGIANNLIVTIESMMALVCMAVITGLLYARFSRPAANIVYSKNLLISPYRDGKSLNLRIINAKKNELDEVGAVVTLIKYNPKTERRSFSELTLERDKIPFIPLSWTIVHPIENSSPFFEFDPEKKDEEWTVYVRVSGIDSITGQPVFSGHAYAMDDIIKDAKFCPCHQLNEQEETLVYLNRVNDYEKLEVVTS